LDLGDLALSELPASLGDMPHLRTLCLGDWKLTEMGDLEWDEERRPPVFTDLSPLARLKQLQTLNLSGCEDVTDVTPLAGILGLQDLDLSCTGVTDLSPLAGLQALQSLNLSSAGVPSLSPMDGFKAYFERLDKFRTDLSPLAGLQGLQSLDLSRTGVAELSPLAGLSNLQYLSLYFCSDVKDLSPLAGLQKLRSLDLLWTGVTDLSPLAGLHELQSLRLWNCKGVTDLAPLASLQALEHLDLSLTTISDLSPLANLEELQSLSLASTRILDLFPLAGLRRLQRLSLSSTGVTDLCPLAELHRLQILNLQGCRQIRDIAPLGGLQELQKLDLQRTGVTDLSPLAKLQGLQGLYLTGCRPTVSAETLRAITSNGRLTQLVANEVVGVPREILSRNYEDDCLPRLRAYLADLELGAEADNEVKVILLGNGRVGKTQLCRRFRGEPFDDSIPSTHGVQIWRKELQVQTGSEEQVFQINWWDFGGQDIYHGTHALFLHSRAVFLILWTPTLENRDEYIENGIPMRNQPVSYWLDYVHSLAGKGSPVVVVQSQCDRFSDRRADPSRPEGFELFECCAYSAKEDRGREILEGQLRNAIGYLLDRNGALEIGKGRAEVRRQLYEWRALDQALPPKDRQHRTLSLDDFQALCDQAGGIVSWEHALDYFHHTGVVFYQPYLFANRIILDQDWALDAVYAVFHRGQAMPWLRNSGRFTRADLAATVWQGYSPEEQRLFLGLMESCGVCFSYRKTLQEEPRYVAPDLLPGFEAVSDRVHLVWDETLDTKTLSLKYRFFHPAVIRSLMSEVGRRAGDLAEYWKYGLWFKDGRWNAQLLVQFKDTSTEDASGAGVLELKAQGRDPLGLLREIHRSILRRHIGEQPEELLTLDGITVARNALSTVIDGQVLDIRGESVPAAPFTAFFEGREYQPDESRSTEKISGIDIRPQPLSPDEKPREVYISYAWGDDSEEGKRRAQAVDGLYAALAKDGFRPVRDKEAMRSGDLISAFIRQLTRADLVVAVISEKYLRSWYCMYEIYKIWQKCQGDADAMVQRVVPIVLPEVRIGNVRERLPYLEHWAGEAESLEALVRNPKISPGGKSWEEVRLVREFAHHVDDILVFLQDVLMPRKLKVHLDDGFEAVREALRRRVREGE
jgi:internalin A